MTFIDLAKLAMQTQDEKIADYAIWNHTPFPFCTDARKLFKALDGYRRACAKGRQLCDFCNRPAVAHFMCSQCEAALSSTETQT